MRHAARIALIERSAEIHEEEARNLRLRDGKPLVGSDQANHDDMLLHANSLRNLANEMRGEAERLALAA